MDTQTLIDGFIKLFAGRGDVYGHEEGMCVKERLTPEVFRDHLFGSTPIGVYPVVPYNGSFLTKWGCSDIDIEDYNMAWRLAEALRQAGVTAWIERSRSKGYHVWVFAESLVLASDMRNMLLAAHQVADIPPREVNPKQTTLKQGQFGNYVRLPYPRCYDTETDKRRMLDDDGKPIKFSDFVTTALSCFTPTATISRLATFYKPPAPPKVVNMDDYGAPASLKDALVHLSPLGKVIWRDGPLQGRDRSTTLARLGHECVRSGMNPSDTKVVLQDADRRWGKYHLRADGGELEIDKLVQRVFS